MFKFYPYLSSCFLVPSGYTTIFCTWNYRRVPRSNMKPFALLIMNDSYATQYNLSYTDFKNTRTHTEEWSCSPTSYKICIFYLFTSCGDASCSLLLRFTLSLFNPKRKCIDVCMFVFVSLCDCLCF